MQNDISGVEFNFFSMTWYGKKKHETKKKMSEWYNYDHAF